MLDIKNIGFRWFSSGFVEKRRFLTKLTKRVQNVTFRRRNVSVFDTFFGGPKNVVFYRKSARPFFEKTPFFSVFGLLRAKNLKKPDFANRTKCPPH